MADVNFGFGFRYLLCDELLTVDVGYGQGCVFKPCGGRFYGYLG